MPVRSIPPNGRSITGQIACFTSGQSYDHESLLERDCILLCSFDAAVASMDTQPVRITYRGRDKLGRTRLCSYTPDLLLRYKDDRPPRLIEVKYEQQLRAEIAKLKPKIQAGARYARRHGWHYRIYTERRIRTVRLENIHFVRRYLGENRDTEHAGLLLACLAQVGRTSIERLLAGCAGLNASERAVLLPSLWRLIAAGEVGVDFDSARLSMTTIIWPSLRTVAETPQKSHDGNY